jgi:hypothetical protein
LTPRKRTFGQCGELLRTVGLVKRLEEKGAVEERDLDFISNPYPQLVQNVLRKEQGCGFSDCGKPFA